MIKPSSHIISLIDKSFSSNQDCAVLTYQCESELVFQDGQFVQFNIPSQIISSFHGEINHIIKRSYSIMSSHKHFLATHQLQFMIKRTPDGLISNWLLDEHREGDSFDIVGPLGKLIIDTSFSQMEEFVFIGTGSGLAPLLSLYQGLGDGVLKHIIYGERTSGDLLPLVTQLIPNQNIILSREQGTGFKYGHVQDLLLKTIAGIKDNQKCGFFLCGKPEMVDDVKHQLINNHYIPAAHIRDEKY